MNNYESILVIEDSTEIQEVLKMLLESEGYVPVLAGTGKDALQRLCSETHFSLILLDVSLPDMRAFEFLEKLAQAEVAESVPIILCSAASDLREMTLPKRVSGILPKPFKIEELFSTISKFKLTPLSNSGLRINFKNGFDGQSRHSV